MNQSGDMVDHGFLGSVLSEGIEELDEKGNPKEEGETLPKMFNQEPTRKQASDPGEPPGASTEPGGGARIPD